MSKTGLPSALWLAFAGKDGDFTQRMTHYRGENGPAVRCGAKTGPIAAAPRFWEAVAEASPTPAQRSWSHQTATDSKRTRQPVEQSGSGRPNATPCLGVW